MDTIRFQEFNSKLESWNQYAERLGHSLDANGVTAAGKKRSHLLSYIGPATYPATYSLLTGLVSPAKLTDKSYDDLVKALSEHYDLKPSEIVERFSRSAAETPRYILRSLVTDVVLRDTYLTSASSKKVNVTVVVNKAIYRRRADPPLIDNKDHLQENLVNQRLDRLQSTQ